MELVKNICESYDTAISGLPLQITHNMHDIQDEVEEKREITRFRGAGAIQAEAGKVNE